MCVLEKQNFKISWGSMPSDRPSIFAPFVLDHVVIPKMVKNAKLKLVKR